MAQDRYVHFSFFIGSNAEAVDYADRPYVMLPIQNEAQFKEFVGQLACNMWDLYKASLACNDDRQELDPLILSILSEPAAAALLNWMREQIRLVRDTEEEHSWKELVIRCGDGYLNFLDAMEEQSMIIHPKVRFIVDSGLGAHDKVCEVVYA
jgi:hypothetical protein